MVGRRGCARSETPSEMLLSQNREEGIMSGIAIGVTVEGIRPLLIEVQALVSSAAYGTPQRSVTDSTSVGCNMLWPYSKKARSSCRRKTSSLNIAGGLKVANSALDLAKSWPQSCLKLEPLPQGTAMAGEVGRSRRDTHCGKRSTAEWQKPRNSDSTPSTYRKTISKASKLQDYSINIVEVL